MPRKLIVDEANAIGTAYLRIDLLPAAAQGELRAGFRRYLDARLAAYRAVPDFDAVEAKLAHADLKRLCAWSSRTRCRASAQNCSAIGEMNCLSRKVNRNM